MAAEVALEDLWQTERLTVFADDVADVTGCGGEVLVLAFLSVSGSGDREIGFSFSVS